MMLYEELFLYIREVTHLPKTDKPNFFLLAPPKLWFMNLPDYACSFQSPPLGWYYTVAPSSPYFSGCLPHCFERFYHQAASRTSQACNVELAELDCDSA